MDDQADLLTPEKPAAPAMALNTAHARDMLGKRFAAPEWACMFEVAPATGGGTRYADALAVNLWNSRGHAIYGFEIKVSRGDWLRELKKPEKAEESVFAYCDRWFIVAPKGVVKDGELPPTWGMFELRESGLLAKVEAPKLTPKLVDRLFFASLMRRGHEQIDAIAESKQRMAVIEATRGIDKRVEEEVKRRSRRADELQEKVRKFCEATGLDFNDYSGPPIATIKLAQKLQSLQGWKEDGALNQLTSLAEQLERAAKTVREAVEHTGLKEGPAT